MEEHAEEAEMLHPDLYQAMIGYRLESLKNDARRAPRAQAVTVAASDDRISLRLCRVGDEGALDGLATLEGVEAPTGRVVLAEVDGRLVAALELCGGAFIADPFRPTAHLRRLLELRAAQIEAPTGPRRHLLGRTLPRSLRA